MNNGIYTGRVKHHRLGPTAHRFGYKLAMMGFDLDKLSDPLNTSILLGQRWYNPLRFVAGDYIRGHHTDLKQKVVSKVRELGGDWPDDKPDARIVALVQCRCLGLYFSPINCYFCFDSQTHCRYLLAEVSNTPWDQRHYYLVDLNRNEQTEKTFHVSPFMPMDMQYHWRIKTGDDLLVQIESSRQGKKQFTATMALQHRAITPGNLLKYYLALPWPTLKIKLAIYWQALKLWRKKVPFIAHPQHK